MTADIVLTVITIAAAVIAAWFAGVSTNNRRILDAVMAEGARTLTAVATASSKRYSDLAGIRVLVTSDVPPPASFGIAIRHECPKGPWLHTLAADERGYVDLRDLVGRAREHKAGCGHA